MRRGSRSVDCGQTLRGARGAGRTPGALRASASVSRASALLLLAAAALLGAPRWSRADEPAPAAPVAPAKSAWQDEALVKRRFTEAMDAVEAASGVTYPTRPTVRISTRKAVVAILEEELRGIASAVGGEDAIQGAVETVSRGLLAKYDLDAHVVHVIPENVAWVVKTIGSDELGGEDALRVILVHECTHALDFPRFGWTAMRPKWSTPDEQKAFGAVVEGHAQWVAEKVAADWGLSKAFDAFTASITFVPSGQNAAVEAIAKGMAAEAGFAYLQGHAFLKAVFAAKGLEGVLAVLRDPPRDTRSIERPALFLTPEASDVSVDLAPILAAFRPLLPEPGWKLQTSRILQAALRSQVEGLPAQEVAHVFDGYRDGQALVGNDPTGGAQVIVLALLYDAEDQAQRWTRADVALSRNKDEKLKTGSVRITASDYAPGAGPGGRLPGTVATKTVRVGSEEITAVVHFTSVGRVAFEIALTGKTRIARAQVDAFLAAVERYVVDPAHPLPKIEVPEPSSGGK